MKNSVKFFLGGAIAATLIFGAFAFTNKQNESKEYLVVRVIEPTKASMGGKSPMIQISDKNGIIELRKEVLEKGRYNGVDKSGKNTAAIAKLIEEHIQKGYKINAITNSLGAVHSITTLIFEK